MIASSRRLEAGVTFTRAVAVDEQLTAAGAVFFIAMFVCAATLLR